MQKFAQFKRHTTRVPKVPSIYKQGEGVQDTKSTLKRIQLTDATGRHPSVTVQLSSISLPRPVREKEREKWVNIKIYSVSNLLVGSYASFS